VPRLSESTADVDVQAAPFEQHLPRLLYVGDLPIEGAMAGAAALYRLLAVYPHERLRIALSNLAVGSGYTGAPRLTGVVHDQFFLAHRRPLYTRLAGVYRWYVLARAPAARAQLQRIAHEFDPQAILTVTVGYSWRLAAVLASRLDVPLHLVSHDDWRVNLDLPRWIQPTAELWFAGVYRQAKGRFVVSPYMAREYEIRYGRPATVLYPSRVSSAPTFDSPAERVRVERPSNFVYAGSVYPRYAELLSQFARVLARVDATLTIYSPLNSEEIRVHNLRLPNVITRPVMRTDEMIERLRREADVLVVPMSFHPDDRSNIEVAFPSKLADYTATGLPILIWGPPYSSAARWAVENDGVAALVQEASDDALLGTLRRLLDDGNYRWSLGVRSLATGDRLFAHTAVAGAFLSALQ
jgi:hypothetical protein